MKKLKIFLLLAMFAFLLAGCRSEEVSEEGTKIYYLNKEATAVVPVSYEIYGDGPEVIVEELLAKL